MRGTKKALRRQRMRERRVEATRARGAPRLRPQSLLWTVLATLPLLGLCVGLLVFSLIPMLYDWSRMRDWERARAHVEFAHLETASTGRGGVREVVRARYHYAVGGVAYTGRRVQIDRAHGKAGAREQHILAQLQHAQQVGRSVPVWVNPRQPAESVVDRSFPAGSVAWTALIVAVSGALSGYVLVFLVHLALAERRAARRHAPGAPNASG